MNRMENIKAKIKNKIAGLAVLGLFGSIFGLIGVYFLAAFCLLATVIWAIIKLVNHFIN